MILKDVCFNNWEKSIWLLPPVLKLLLYPSYHIFSALFCLRVIYGVLWGVRARPSCSEGCLDYW